MTRCRLYLVTPPAFEPAAFAQTLARALDGGDVACVQIRLKGADDAAIARAAEAILPVAQPRGVAVLINDRPDLAVALGADGAHVGQSDMPAREARRLLGPHLSLGVTCHDSRHLAMQAGEDGADYVAFGAFHPTATKETAHRAEPDLLRWWSELFELPCVAIGGITLANASPLIAAGADFLAVSSGVWDHPEGPAAAVAGFAELMAEADSGSVEQS
ncbi:MAG: thiamine phosphate synthase [Alphaproteobacteria bacterium]|nr:thiamine phosphate synthase [Alphaproteobacteria bacterium]